jgi:prepilin-type processing-associated H-X9-DG protein
MNNGKQMMIALHLYTLDHNDLYPPNPDDGNTTKGHNWCAGQAGKGGGEEYNPDVLKDPEKTLLAPYIGNNIKIFKCPADKRPPGIYRGTDPNLKGTKIEAVRTFAMSQAVGTICPGFDSGSGHRGVPTLSVNGPWLDNAHSHRRNRPWRTFGKAGDFVDPGPAQTWVLLDEDARSLNDAGFAVGMVRPAWIDYPGTYHNNACGFAFADGHSEIHKWIESTTRLTRDPSGQLDVTRTPRDWQWISQRTSARVQ